MCACACILVCACIDLYICNLYSCDLEPKAIIVVIRVTIVVTQITIGIHSIRLSEANVVKYLVLLRMPKHDSSY